MTNPLFDALLAPHLGHDTVFIHQPDGGVVSHADFLDNAARIANTLNHAGLQPGDRVAVQVPKSVEALALYAASVMAGIVFLPLNTAYTTEELSYFIADSGAALVIGDPSSAEALQGIVDNVGASIMTLGANGHGTLMDSASTMPASFNVVERGEDDLAALLYTSGTTGRSKGAMLSQKNLLSNALSLKQEWQYGPDDVLLHALPIYHTHGLFVACNITLLAGGSMIFLPGFDRDRMIELMPKATSMMGVPTFYTRLLDDDRLNRDLTRHMRLFISGSAPLLAETHEQFEHRTGHRILERYGMTETNMNTSNPYAGDRRAGTVGFPLPGVEVRITNPEDGTPLPQGDTGVVEVRGDNVFMGYWNMPEKTSEEFRADGFFITGDLGRIDDDGYLTILGRGKDLIISGGLNIYPKEIEDFLNDQPGVGESAVIGVPHADFGEGVMAVITSAPDAAPDTDAIMEKITTSLARFKHPRRIVVVDALPRNTMGKVQKNVLRETYKDSFTG